MTGGQMPGRDLARSIRAIAYAAAMLVCAGRAGIGLVPEAQITLYPGRHALVFAIVHSTILAVVALSIAVMLVGLHWRKLRAVTRGRFVSWVFALGTFVWCAAAVWAFMVPAPIWLSVFTATSAIGISAGLAG